MKTTERPLAQRTCGSAAHGLTVRGCATQRVAQKRGAAGAGPAERPCVGYDRELGDAERPPFWIFIAPKLQASRDSYFGERRAAHGGAQEKSVFKAVPDG